MKFREYTKAVAEHLDDKYKDLIENIYANDLAWDLSIGIEPKKAYKERSGRINAYYKDTYKGKEIFDYVLQLMKL